ncbi:hypothetical protein PV08_09076 [Exophiala spinifera]|uniref:Yeast cell wall synthesis Kre9/Knh1-like N-terminal domain-containing protein n=1 Tax=Exophiala spinifera TaxID=91928 RepID=A0A0D2BKK1_9EURO|nr:uncharacterized protein PV08_09076 [Exophiala spinifera]KIW11804.1 hypothetical protein PV08_09076 [Exophiala spinifera]
MHSLIAPLMVAGFASLAQAFTKPTESTWGPLLEPDLTHPVTQGETFDVTWDPENHPTDNVTVSLVLCHGPSSNCVPSDSAIASGLPASSKSFSWDVPCDLAPGTQSTSTGYGMLIIVDGTGEFQYSTQFSVLEGKTCSTSGSGPSNNSTSPSSTVTNSAGSVVILPPTQQTGSAHPGSNGTIVTASGPSWTGSGISIPTTTATDISSLVTVTFSSGSIVSTAIVTAAPTVATAGATTTGSAPATTFTGAAAQVALNGAGMVLAGAVAIFAL